MTPEVSFTPDDNLDQLKKIIEMNFKSSGFRFSDTRNNGSISESLMIETQFGLKQKKQKLGSNTKIETYSIIYSIFGGVDFFAAPTILTAFL